MDSNGGNMGFVDHQPDDDGTQNIAGKMTAT
jgi:hypothetical protein